MVEKPTEVKVSVLDPLDIEYTKPDDWCWVERKAVKLV